MYHQILIITKMNFVIHQYRLREEMIAKLIEYNQLI